MADTGYATVSQLKVALANDAALSDTRAQELLNQTAATVDAALTAAGYTAPANGANDVLLIGQYVVNGAAAAAWREMYADDTEPDRVTAWDRTFQAFLKSISTGAIRLMDQSTAEGGGLRAGRLTWKRTPASSEWG